MNEEVVRELAEALGHGQSMGYHRLNYLKAEVARQLLPQRLAEGRVEINNLYWIDSHTWLLITKDGENEPVAQLVAVPNQQDPTVYHEEAI